MTTLLDRMTPVSSRRAACVLQGTMNGETWVNLQYFAVVLSDEELRVLKHRADLFPGYVGLRLVMLHVGIATVQQFDGPKEIPLLGRGTQVLCTGTGYLERIAYRGAPKLCPAMTIYDNAAAAGPVLVLLGALVVPVTAYTVTFNLIFTHGLTAVFKQGRRS